MKASGLLKWIVGIFLIVILVGVALSNYSAGLYLAVGVAVLIVISVIVSIGGWKGMLITIVLVGCAAVGLFGWMLLGIRHMSTNLLPCRDGDVRMVKEITGYSAVIEPVDFQMDSFQVTEHITYQETEDTCVAYRWESKLIQDNLEADLPGRTVQGAERGLFVHEVAIPVSPEGFECCPDSASIELKNIPFNSFYDAQFADDLKEDEYLGNVSVTWKVAGLGEGIHFAYLPSPFHNLRVVVSPLIELSKNENWVLTGMGFVFSGIILAAVKGTLTDLLKDKMKGIFKRKEDHPDNT